MKVLTCSVKILLKQISRDNMVGVLCVAPLLVALLFYFGIPILSSLLETEYNFKDLSEYGRLFDLLLAVLTPYLFGFASAMVILEEIDEHIVPSFYASPLGRKGYLISRLLFPTIISILITVLIISAFHLSDLGAVLLIVLSVLAAIVCLIPFLLIVTLAKNKVEGMALAKISGLILIGLFIPFFITSNTQYIFAFMPSFWLAKLIISSNYLYMIPTLICSFVWLWILYDKFCKKI
ncbi:ABC transporter permease [Parabacteroides sp. OttesenSCG-928-J18]|nr:ABC transporter permease [Parabacteroides sp. OttesenSCG-928-J18]